jgi:hypothetical protein
MNVVGHVDVTVDLDAEPSCRVPQPGVIEQEVPVTSEYALAIIASMDDVDWESRNKSPERAGHA